MTTLFESCPNGDTCPTAVLRFFVYYYFFLKKNSDYFYSLRDGNDVEELDNGNNIFYLLVFY